MSTFLCNDLSGCPIPSLLHPRSLTLAKLKAEIPWPENGFLGLIDPKVIAWAVAYHALSLALQLLLPGTEVKGTQLGTGGHHKYKFNAFVSACVILVGLAVG